MTPAELKELRGALSLSQQDLADLFRVDERTAKRWESGENEPDPNNMQWLDALREYSRRVPDPRGEFRAILRLRGRLVAWQLVLNAVLS